jgi:glutamate/tyrosine decarboxylase-like PLP-dependent enzyme
MSLPIPQPSAEELESILDQIKSLVVNRYTSTSPLTDFVVPSAETLTTHTQRLIQKLPETGLGLEPAFTFVKDTVIPALSNQSTETYLGFVTGGATPAALVGDYIVSLFDQNVHRYGDSLAAVVENVTLSLILEFVYLDPSAWKGRLVTTGATASNILALAVGREHVLAQHIAARAGPGSSGNMPPTSEIGLFKAMKLANLEGMQVLHCLSHSSISKACAVLGLGSNAAMSVSDVSKPWCFDLVQLEERLAMPNMGSIVVVSFGEVNTGRYTRDIPKIRVLCDKYHAWLHIDGAFGIYSSALKGANASEYQAKAIEWTDGLELGDSITGDAHKSLNVPYDCGFFFCRDETLLQSVFKNPGAAYLAAVEGAPVNPLDKGIENSRRFRALPLYLTLLAYGRTGYQLLVNASIRAARLIAQYIASSETYILLPDDDISEISTIVLFSAKSDVLNAELLSRINSSRAISLSSTQWHHQPAVRVAVSNWKIDAESLAARVVKELVRVAGEFEGHL